MLFFFLCDLGSEGVEYGHVVRHLDELLLHVAEDGQGVAEQHLQLTQCRAKTKKFTVTSQQQKMQFLLFLYEANQQTGVHSYLRSLEQERIPNVEVGVDWQAVHEETEEPVDGEEGRVHAVTL